MVPVVFAVAAFALSWRDGTLARLRARWSLGTTIRAAVLALGLLIVANEEMSHLSQTWQLSTRHYKHRMVDLGASAAGALTIGLGVLPVLLGLALLARAPGERRSDAMSAFRAVLASSIVAFTVYTAMKATYLSTNFATRVQERNLFYLAPLFLVATAVWLERPRLRLGALAASALAVGLLLQHLPIQLDWPYFEAPGFSLLALFNRELSAAQATMDGLLLPLLGIALALALLPLALRRYPAVRTAALTLVALLVIAWNGAGSWAANAGSHEASSAEMANFPDPPNWIDRVTGGRTTLYLGQTIQDPTGIWLNEFWNGSLRYVWSLDATAPGPGPTITPNLLGPDGMIASQRGDLKYVLADPGIAVVGRVVAQPTFGLAGSSFRLFRIAYPLRLTHSITGLYGDGWSGSGQAAYNGFRTPDGRPQQATVVASRAGWGGPGLTAKVVVRAGALGLDTAKAPKLARVSVTRSCTVHSRTTCSVTFRTPPPPFRIEVTVPNTFSPHDLDPRYGDARRLGAQISFGLAPAARRP
jgi:hypothetical protein